MKTTRLLSLTRALCACASDLPAGQREPYLRPARTALALAADRGADLATVARLATWIAALELPVVPCAKEAA